MSIHRYESGCSISRKNLEKIAEACDVPPEKILNPRTYQVDSPLRGYNREEKGVIEEYRKLSRWGKTRVKEYMHEMTMLYPKPEEDDNKT